MSSPQIPLATYRLQFNRDLACCRVSAFAFGEQPDAMGPPIFLMRTPLD